MNLFFGLIFIGFYLFEGISKWYSILESGGAIDTAKFWIYSSLICFCAPVCAFLQNIPITDDRIRFRARVFSTIFCLLVTVFDTVRDWNYDGTNWTRWNAIFKGGIIPLLSQIMVIVSTETVVGMILKERLAGGAPRLPPTGTDIGVELDLEATITSIG